MPERLIKYLFSIALIACGLLCSCSEDDTIAEPNNVLMALSVDTRAATATVGAPTLEEQAVYSLRVYAFVKGRPAGHHFVEGENLTVPTNFLMDVALYSTSDQTVDFYLIANEKALVGVGLSDNPQNTSPNFISESTTKAQLEELIFHGIVGTAAEATVPLPNGLPMFCKKSVTLNFNESTAFDPNAYPGHINADEHDGHSILTPKNEDDLKFFLERPVAKLGVFAAKHYDETGEEPLIIKKLTILKQGTRSYNFLMPQTDTKLEGVDMNIGGIDLDITTEAGTTGCKKFEFADNDENYEVERLNPENYTLLMDDHHYPFENPFGNGGDWNKPGGGKESVIEIQFCFGENGDLRTGMIYLPKIERNHYYTVLCMMHNTGKITVEYDVADWDYDENKNSYGEDGLNFTYPKYNNPLTPPAYTGDGASENLSFQQPVVTNAGSWDVNEAGVCTFEFNVTEPENFKWTPVLFSSSSSSSSSFVYNVFVKNEQGNYEEVTKTTADVGETNEHFKDGHYVGTGEYQIRVKSNKTTWTDDDPAELIAYLGINFIPMWDAARPRLLMINGAAGKTPWAGSDNEELIAIKQVKPSTGN